MVAVVAAAVVVVVVVIVLILVVVVLVFASVPEDARVSKARGYNMLDVEISRSAWKGRDGGTVRQYVGRYAKQVGSTLREDAARALRAATDLEVHADVVARAVAKYRAVFTGTERERQDVMQQLHEVFIYMQDQGLGAVKTASNGWPYFTKTMWHFLPAPAKKWLLDMDVPIFSFQPLPQILGSDCSHPAGRPEAGPRAPRHGEAGDGSADGVEGGSGNAKPVSRQGQQGAPSDLAMQSPKNVLAGQAATKVADSRESVAETETPWEVLFDGEPRKAVENYKCLRAEVEQLLGASHDPGVYTFVDLGVEGPTRRLKAACKPQACKGCARQLRASFRFVDAGPLLLVRVRGKHGTLQKPSGGSLWTAAEEHMLAAKIAEGAHVTAKLVRAVFKQANMPLRCTDGQLHAWVSRTRKNLSELPPKPKKGLTAAEMYAAASSFIGDIAQWRTQPLHKLIMLPNPVFQEDRVCAIWTCPGMLSRAEAARNKVVKLAIDGKQKIVANNYSVLTLSFLVSSEHVTQTRDSRARVSSRPKVHTLTQEPFMQALVNSEAEENVTQFFTAACEIASQQCKLDLKTQVWQVHKDYAKGIEAARRNVFPSARPCDDYPHMRRASYSVLKQKMGATTACRPQFFFVCPSLRPT